MERAVIVEKLVKNFDVTEKEAGLRGALKSMFAPKKRQVKALRNITFSIQPGELVGFIGPNGAGKTTTLKVLSGLLYPTDGFISVDGFNPWERKPEFLKKISLTMGQKNQLWWDLPAIDTFELNKAIYDIPPKIYKENLDELITLLDLGKLLKTPVRKLSLGQRMRMELVAALLHKPKILFFDEPTIGLDLVAQQRVRDFIYEYNRKNNATILLTSHNMDDLVDLARRVIVINEGQILFDGIFEELVKQFAAEKLITIRLTDPGDLRKLEQIGGVKKITYPEVKISVPRLNAAQAASELLQNMKISDLTIVETPIEDIVRKVFKGELKKKQVHLSTKRRTSLRHSLNKKR